VAREGKKAPKKHTNPNPNPKKGPKKKREEKEKEAPVGHVIVKTWSTSTLFIYGSLEQGPGGTETETLKKQGVCHPVALPFTLKLSILRPKKNYGNSNISPCQNIIFKKILKKKSKILHDIINLLYSGKRRLRKLKYFTMPKYNLQINPLKEIQNPSRY
jgi:hypothetical protein